MCYKYEKYQLRWVHFLRWSGSIIIAWPSWVFFHVDVGLRSTCCWLESRVIFALLSNTSLRQSEISELFPPFQLKTTQLMEVVRNFSSNQQILEQQTFLYRTAKFFCIVKAFCVNIYLSFSEIKEGIREELVFNFNDKFKEWTMEVALRKDDRFETGQTIVEVQAYGTDSSVRKPTKRWLENLLKRILPKRRRVDNGGFSYLCSVRMDTL